MARALVKYMSSAKAIRSAILSEFDWSPSVSVISAMRGTWLRQKAVLERGKRAPGYDARGWDWSGNDYAEKMARTNSRFLSALESQRSQLVQL